MAVTPSDHPQEELIPLGACVSGWWPIKGGTLAQRIYGGFAALCPSTEGDVAETCYPVKSGSAAPIRTLCVRRRASRASMTSAHCQGRRLWDV